MFKHTQAIAKNIGEAVRYYHKSFDLACPDGMFNLADMLQHGKQAEKDVFELVRLCTLTAETGHEKDFFHFANCMNLDSALLKRIVNLQLSVRGSHVSLATSADFLMR
jgi:TPR repeat protein